MKVRAYYIKKNFKPLSKGGSPAKDETYTKTVTVPDNSNMKSLEAFAKADASPGFRFFQLLKVKND